jgi:neural Wiskott-Aldrich syndrome protein
MSDTSKTIRSFQCRDALWEKFEQMARELECSVDYLINDSMKQYARQRGYGSTRGGGLPAPSRTSLQPPAAMTSSAPTVPPPVPAAPPPMPPPPVMQPLAPVPQHYQTSHMPAPPPLPALGAPPPAPRQRSRTPMGAPPLPPGASHSPPPPPPPPMMAAPPLPTSALPPQPRTRSATPQHAPPPPRVAGAPRRAINVYYMGQRFTVTKDRFIIGRGKQSSDLTIKDPNVSRQHALVEFLSGQYFIVDMGSTNGVEYMGQRVQRQPINEGDVFRVCDHELRFSYY